MGPDPKAFKAGSGATLRDPKLRANYRRATRGGAEKFPAAFPMVPV